MIKYISERIYEVFRVDGLKNNSQVSEALTVAVQQEATKNSFGDLGIDIPAGNIASVTSVNKFGYAPDGVQSSGTDIWDRADATPTQQQWLPPQASRTHQIKSTSVLDDIASIGTRKIKIYGLTDWDTNEVTEIIEMDGTTNVPTVNTYVIIHRMKHTEGGALGINAGNITATADTDATITAQININFGQTEMAIYGIPSTQVAYLTNWYASIHKSSGVDVDVLFELQYNPFPDNNLVGFTTKEVRGLASNGVSSDSWGKNPYNKFEGPGILKVEATGSASDIDTAAGFDLILVNN